MSIFSPLTDAIFEPLAARQQVERARFDASATANNVLLEVAELHFELLAAEADLRVRRESATQAAEVARLTRAYAKAGQGREADAQRAATEFSLIVDEIRQAEEELAVAAARLSRRLHLDQSVRLSPIAPAIEMVTIVDPAVSVPDLIQTALQGRPEFRARAAALAAAETPSPTRTVSAVPAHALARLQRWCLRRRQQPGRARALPLWRPDRFRRHGLLDAPELWAGQSRASEAETGRSRSGRR